MDKLVKQISNSIEQLQALFQAQLPTLELAVNDLIKSNTKDEEEIYRLMDVLLDFQFVGIGEDVFLKLLEYCKTVNQEAAADYKEIYEEI